MRVAVRRPLYKLYRASVFAQGSKPTLLTPLLVGDGSQIADGRRQAEATEPARANQV
jgi:hypothetical protein